MFTRERSLITLVILYVKYAQNYNALVSRFIDIRTLILLKRKNFI